MSKVAHENADAVREPVWLGTAVTVLATGVGVVVAAFMLSASRGRMSLMPQRPRWYLDAPHEVNAVEAQPFTEETDAEQDEAAASLRLSRYGWVDRDRGLVHIPIDRAIDLYLRRKREKTP